MPSPRTLFDKIWDRHVVAEAEGGETLLYVDRCLIHEGSRHAFAMIEAQGRRVRRPAQVLAVADHYVPTRDRAAGLAGIGDAKIRGMIELLAANTARYGVTLFGLDDERQGILHVVGPEQGITQPGMLITGADSHTSTHGALGCFAFGIGQSEAAHVLATQTIWQRRPKSMRVSVDGRLGTGVTAKDVILAVVARIGSGGAAGHVIEYAGPAISAMSMEERLTVCNMSIEAGARAGMVAPDATTFGYLAERRYAPKGAAWERALGFWRALPSDEDAVFDTEVALDAAALAPMVTWGTNPEHALPVTGRVPDPDAPENAPRRADLLATIEYMRLTPGTRLTDIAVDRVFIGSCTNGRLDDLRAAAAVARHGKATVPVMVVPGSAWVKRQAEAEGLDRVFRDAGFEWLDAGCSMCTALNGDQLRPRERCASTSNRNFRGRQGPEGRTHLMSPAMAAAAGLAGHIADVRMLG